jgi:hypothetical protein
MKGSQPMITIKMLYEAHPMYITMANGGFTLMFFFLPMAPNVFREYVPLTQALVFEKLTICLFKLNFGTQI